eukprot:5993682-Lingulodinium_polyedra.AAC.1
MGIRGYFRGSFSNTPRRAFHTRTRAKTKHAQLHGTPGKHMGTRRYWPELARFRAYFETLAPA